MMDLSRGDMLVKHVIASQPWDLKHSFYFSISRELAITVMTVTALVCGASITQSLLLHHAATAQSRSSHPQTNP